jgi:hypothetical protein
MSKKFVILNHFMFGDEESGFRETPGSQGGGHGSVVLLGSDAA